MNPFHRVTDLLVRRLPKQRIEQLRAGYFAARRQLAPLNRLIHGTFSTDDLRAHLEQKLDGDYEILMVHGSINGMAPTYTGNALELVKMLTEMVGPDRTLAMPAFFFGDPKIGTVAQTFTADPRFNLKRTPSQMGLFTELFRRSRGVKQSRHPVYRVSALGPLAEALTAGHENALTPAGKSTPFEFMAAHKTRVLGIGKSYHVMTQVHHVDDLLGDELPVPRKPVAERSQHHVTVIDGKQEVPVVLNDNGIQWVFSIDKLPSLLQPGDLEYWKFHNVPLFSADAGRVTEHLIEAAGQGKALYDPA